MTDTAMESAAAWRAADLETHRSSIFRLDARARRGLAVAVRGEPMFVARRLP